MRCPSTKENNICATVLSLCKMSERLLFVDAMLHEMN